MPGIGNVLTARSADSYPKGLQSFAKIAGLSVLLMGTVYAAISAQRFFFTEKALAPLQAKHFYELISLAPMIQSEDAMDLPIDFKQEKEGRDWSWQIKVRLGTALFGLQMQMSWVCCCLFLCRLKRKG